MTVMVVAALVRRGEAVLLVRQRGPADAEAHWSLPGGVVEPGERLTEALGRELREETGLELQDPGRVLYAVQTSGHHDSYLALVFETGNCQGELRCADPDGLVSEAEFVPCEVALARLAALPWRNMREPVTAYLRGEVGAGATWLYQRTLDDLVLEAVLVP
jgi:8-oxo-dGTP diphosphatase